MSEERLPLSLEQRTAVASRKISTWNFHLSYHFPGSVNREALASALAVVTARHDPLRLRLIPPEHAWQRFAAPVDEFPLETVECGEADAERVKADFFAGHLDLTGEGPLRALLLRFGDSHRLLLAVHHLAWDALSPAPFDRELWSAYRALRTGRSPELPPLRTSYRDHVRRQAEAGSGLTEEQSRYWKGIFHDWHPDQTSGSHPVPDRGDWLDPWAGLTSGPVPSSHVQRRIGLLARSLRVTPAAAWLAVILVALWTPHHDDRVCLYWIHHGRDRPELFDLVGFFSRVVPLRLRLRPTDRFGDLCGHTYEQVRAGIRHSAPPWNITGLADQVVGPPPDPGRARPRMSRVFVNIQLPQLVDSRVAGPGAPADGAVEPTPLRAVVKTPRPGQFWLFAPIGSGWPVFAEYDRRRFPDRFIGRCLGGIEAIATEVAERGAGLLLGELRQRVDAYT